jgi:hypothetical protein
VENENARLKKGLHIYVKSIENKDKAASRRRWNAGTAY